MNCECELKKLLSERKMAQNGPVEKKKQCPLSQSPICPSHAQPHGHILFERISDFPTSQTIGTSNRIVYPLTPQDSSCDPCQPCPSVYHVNRDDVSNASASKYKKVTTIPTNFPAYGKCPKTIGTIDGNTSIVTCPEDLPEDGQEENISLDGLASKPYNSGGPLEELMECIKNLKSLMKASPEFKKKDLTVPHSTLASRRRTISCKRCSGDLVSTSVLKQDPVHCPFLKIVDMCEATCPCEDIPPIDTGPPCPFAPKPCPCCGAVKCPQSRRPSCVPCVPCSPKIERKPTPPCKCCCPTIPSSCTSSIPPPQCRKHSNINPAPCPLSPPKCKCTYKCERKESPKCPFVPNLFTDCPLLPADQCTPCSDIKPPLPNKPQLKSTATMTQNLHK